MSLWSGEAWDRSVDPLEIGQRLVGALAQTLTSTPIAMKEPVGRFAPSSGAASAPLRPGGIEEDVGFTDFPQCGSRRRRYWSKFHNSDDV